MQDDLLVRDCALPGRVVARGTEFVLIFPNQQDKVELFLMRGDCGLDDYIGTPSRWSEGFRSHYLRGEAVTSDKGRQ